MANLFKKIGKEIKRGAKKYGANLILPGVDPIGGLGDKIQGAFNKISGRDAIDEQAKQNLAGFDRANTLLGESYGQARGDLAPYRDFGVNTLKQYNDLQANPNSIADDPFYKFRVSEGENAIKRLAAARGNLFSGGTGVALQERGQNLAKEEFANKLNRLLQALQFGANAAGGSANAATQYGQNLSQTALGAAGVRADRGVDKYNAGRNTLTDLIKLGGSIFGGGG